MPSTKSTPRICVSLGRSWPYLLGWHWLTYSRLLRRCGGAPRFVKYPRGEHIRAEDEAAKALADCDAVMLSGGDHVSAALYRTPRGGGAVSSRDRFELALVQLAHQTGRPVLGICRGCQLVNVALGGTLAPLPASLRQRCGRSYGVHPIALRRNSLVRSALGCGRVRRVLSFNRQAVQVVGPGLNISARTPDGVVAAVEVADEQAISGWCVGVQWHPDLFPGPHIDAKLIDSFVDAAHQYQVERNH